jgi:hypothetical protein
VTPESAVTKRSQEFPETARTMARLDRIVIDEGHTVMEGSPRFRPRLAELAALGLYDVPLVHMAQERIRLATKGAVQDATLDHHMLHDFIDESFGWERGFFASMFRNPGVARKNNAANAPGGVQLDDVNAGARFMAPPFEETLQLRNFIVMDLAVLAESSDKVVCAVSAMGCRLLAVMMGGESAIQQGNWVNVHEDCSWAGIDW